MDAAVSRYIVAMSLDGNESSPGTRTMSAGLLSAVTSGIITAV